MLYTCVIPVLENNTIATVADDTAIMTTEVTHAEAVEKVQTKQSNIQIIQRFQNKLLRGIVNAPWYI